MPDITHHEQKSPPLGGVPPAAGKIEEQLAQMALDIKKIKRRLLTMAIGSYARLIILLIPIIIAAVYLPPLLRGVLAEYGSLLQGVSGAAQIDAILKQLNP